MKKLLLIGLTTLLMQGTYAAPVITAVTNNGSWAVNGTWDLNRIPMDGDIINIPATKSVIINTIQSLNSVTIKISGILTMSGGKLLLDINSIIYVYAGARIIGTGSPSEQLRLGNLKLFQGNGPALAGPLMASSSTNGFQAFSTLPVKFIGFTLSHMNNGILAQWSTAEEINTERFELERSTNGANWGTIAYIKAAGNSSTVNNYSFIDQNPVSQVVYYRVKEVDVDGKASYTDVKLMQIDVAGEIRISAVQQKVLLQFPEPVRGNVVVRFVSPGGQIAEEQTLSGPAGQVILSTRVKGNYFVSVSNGQGMHASRHLIL